MTEVQKFYTTSQNNWIGDCLQTQMPWPQKRDQGCSFVLYEHTARTSSLGAAASLSFAGSSVMCGEEKTSQQWRWSQGMLDTSNQFAYLSHEMCLIMLSNGASSPQTPCFLRRCTVELQGILLQVWLLLLSCTCLGKTPVQ